VLTGTDAVPMALLMLAGVGTALLADLMRTRR
jgi:hypothetical protein